MMVIEQNRARVALVEQYMEEPPPTVPPSKDFVPKCSNLPRLEQYTARLPAQYWTRWNKRGLEQLLPVRSWVEAGSLRKLAKDLEYRDEKRLGRVCERLEKGADIGCQGRGRLATGVKNNPSDFEFGERVANSLQQWVEEGIAAGPLREEEIPWKASLCPP